MGPFLVSLPIHASLRGRLRAVVVRERSSQGRGGRKGWGWATSMAGRPCWVLNNRKPDTVAFSRNIGFLRSEQRFRHDSAAYRMLRRRPAYCARSWAHLAFWKPRVAAPGQNRVDCHHVLRGGREQVCVRSERTGAQGENSDIIACTVQVVLLQFLYW